MLARLIYLPIQEMIVISSAAGLVSAQAYFQPAWRKVGLEPEMGGET